MDRDMLQRRLTPAEELTAKGARLIAEQRERVAVLERHCAEAKELLAHLEELRAMQFPTSSEFGASYRRVHEGAAREFRHPLTLKTLRNCANSLRRTCRRD